MIRFAVALVVLGAPALASAQTSTRLTDVVRQTGSGTINLLRDVTPAALEAFRTQAGGNLFFAVDVNEAASGTEKASSQGVALESVVLRVTAGGVTTAYTVFETDTQALIASRGLSERVPRFTLLGEAGSARIAGASSIRAEFDSVLRVACPVALTTATAVSLEIRLLSVEPSLGDPETFYDYSGGYEDLAIVDVADAGFLTTQAAGVTDAPAVIPVATVLADRVVESWVSMPSSSGYYTVAYEDQFPARGDYDFNDLVVSYRVDLGLNSSGRVIQLSGTAFLVARGAGYSHDWHLRARTISSPTGVANVLVTDPETLVASRRVIPVAGEIDILAFAGTRALFPPPTGDSFTNTELGSTFVVGPRMEFSVTLDASIPYESIQAAPLDPYLVIIGVGYEVHLPDEPATPGSLNVAEGLTSFRDANGYPFAMSVPDTWSFPYEHVDLGDANPELLPFVASRETMHKDWYRRPRGDLSRRFDSESWHWVPPG